MIQSAGPYASSVRDVSLPLTINLLRLLSHREFRSGEELARAVGLSRARVCQALNQAQSLGVRLHRLPGKGYRLAEALSVLDSLAVQAALPEGTRLKVQVLEETASTNTALISASNAGEDIHGRVLAAEMQTAGRGRMGRSWISRFGGSLTFSLGWRFESGAASLSGLSLAVGVALARGMSDLGYRDVRLKWPNDLIHTHRKLGGVLVELAGDALGPTTAVIGVGINVNLPAEARGDIAQAVVDLSEIGPETCDRNRLLESLLARLEAACREFGRDGFSPFAADWQALHAYHGRAVRLTEPGGRSSEGVVEGVDDTGALLLAAAGGTRRLVAGELSLRRVA